MKELSKAYEPAKYEGGIYEKWSKSGYFNPDKCLADGFADEKRYFSIVLPPPNVTGVLHIGHASMLAIEDLMVRYHRMKGDQTLWVPGTDHAAIATQTKVEKLLIEKGIKDPKKDLGRDKFLAEVHDFAQKSHDTIIGQCKKMGSSLDWSREAFTLDEPRSLAVRMVFKKMYDDGLIYRGYRIVNWCPRCHSTLADDEVEYKPTKTKLYWIKYGPFVLATTRPETKLGDTAVAVHPDDARYKEMIGKKYQIPGVLGDFEITVVADEGVDMNFGSGAIKVTPYHSFVDYEIAKKNNIPGKQIIDEDGRMMANCGKYAGMTTIEARKAIVADMETMGLIDHIDENYENSLSICYRCGAAIEPIPSRQWFIDVNKEFKLPKSNLKGIESGAVVTLKKLMLQVVENKQIEIIPDRFEKTYFHWINNLRDWCISRQIWYGHQIPVWYKGEEVYVGVEAPRGDGWQQDSDTLDTWFSSGLWTFSTLGWSAFAPEELRRAKPAPPMEDAGNSAVGLSDFERFHPTTVMETGYDILFFWVARMILMTTYALGEIPFETVYLHGLVRDEQGRKMSKSLGNVIDPLTTIAEYGADATRLSLIIGNSPGNDLRLSEEKVGGFRNFTNKIWNMARFMLLNIEDAKADVKTPEAKTDADRWILGALDEMVRETTENIEKYNYSYAGEKLRDFTWGEIADWYLEIAKIEGGKSEILNYILNTLLKLWHPFMPFVTEAIWSEIYPDASPLMVARWPEVAGGAKNVTTGDFDKIREVVTAIRMMRSENKIEPAKKIDAIIVVKKDSKIFTGSQAIIAALARIGNLNISDQDVSKEGKVVVVAGGVEVLLDLSGVVDVAKETDRIAKEIASIKPYVTGLRAKLSNESFVGNAPEAVVAKEKNKLMESEEKLAKLEEQLKMYDDKK
ncbi:MAG TPA: valine--tRNA ligase [Candidatus Magasanikbacteria bacterium]|nr:valine--tRNA ligase [Candidatus Magasanikbacteria bacterium]